MRISKSHFFVDIRSDHTSQVSGFRYLLYQLIGEEETLLYESHRFRHKANCVAKANEHLEKVISWDNLNSQLLSWAA